MTSAWEDCSGDQNGWLRHSPSGSYFPSNDVSGQYFSTFRPLGDAKSHILPHGSLFQHRHGFSRNSGCVKHQRQIHWGTGVRTTMGNVHFLRAERVLM